MQYRLRGCCISLESYKRESVDERPELAETLGGVTACLALSDHSFEWGASFGLPGQQFRPWGIPVIL